MSSPAEVHKDIHASDCALSPHLPHACRLQHGDPGDQGPHPGKRGTQSYQHLTAVWNSLDSICRPKPMEGITDTHEDERGAETDRSLALSAGQDAPNKDLN